MQDQPLLFRPLFLLRAEALCALSAACVAYQLLFPHHWVMFALLFLVPDLSLLTYARGPSAAASCTYNLVHNYVLPILLGAVAVFLHRALLGELSLIWIAHIGMDRALGYGLKYSAAFRFTHIQSAAHAVIAPDRPPSDPERMSRQ